MFGESNVETYITICKINSQWEFAVGLRKFKQGLWINLGQVTFLGHNISLINILG